MRGVLGEGLKKSLYEAVKMKPGSHWRFQDDEDARFVGYLLRRAEDLVWTSPRDREVCYYQQG